MSEPTAISNALLKDTMSDAMVFRGTARTMDVMTPGYYLVTAEITAEIPKDAYDYGILEVVNVSVFIKQVYTPHDNVNFRTTGFWVRTWYNKKWTEWRRYAYLTT